MEKQNEQKISRKGKRSTFDDKDVIKNKYYKWYFQLIDKAIKRDKPEGYSEKHHIIPRSYNGSEARSNLVRLTAREHYIAHSMLMRFTVGQLHYKMCFAFTSMNALGIKDYKGECIDLRLHKEWYFNSRLFENSRLMRSKALSEWLLVNTPFKNPEIHAKTIRNREANGNNIFTTNNPMHNPELIRKKVENCPSLKGRKQWYNPETDEARMSVEKPEGGGWINTTRSRGVPNKNKGVPKPRIKCAFCDRMLTKQTISRHIEAFHNGKDNEN